MNTSPKPTQPKQPKMKKSMTQFALTQEDREALDLYLRQLPKFTTMLPGDEQTVFRRIAAGDGLACTHIISANLRLVVKIAKTYAGRGVPLEDLIQEGSIGLMSCLWGFDYSRDPYIRFSTYSHPYIELACDRAIARLDGLVHIPHRVHVAQYSREEELTDSMRARVQDARKSIVSLDKEHAVNPFKGDDDLALRDSIA